VAACSFRPGSLRCLRACAAVSSSPVPRHARRAISTPLQPPGAHPRLCNRPGHLPDGARIHPGAQPRSTKPALRTQILGPGI
jgi:hypothetical protein